MIKAFSRIYHWLLAHHSVVSILFFIMIHGVGTYALFYNRHTPPEPDDTFAYITKIEQFRQFSSPFDPGLQALKPEAADRVLYLPWAFALGSLARFTGLSSSTIFHLSFYMGIILAAPLLYISLRRLTGNPYLTSLTIALLALYTGEGEYHGFFWIVPSFYTTVLFFYIASLVLTTAPLSYWKFVLANLIYIPLHPSAIISYGPILLAGIISAVNEKSLQLLKKMLTVLMIAGLIFITYQQYYASHGIAQGDTSLNWVLRKTLKRVQHTIHEPLGQASPIPPSQINEYNQNLEHNYRNYLYLYLKPLTISSFFIFFILGFRYAPRALQSLYIGTLVLAGIAIVHPFGTRGLTFLWPTTYILIAQGMLVFLSKKPHKLLLIALCIEVLSIILFPVISHKESAIQKIQYVSLLVILCLISFRAYFKPQKLQFHKAIYVMLIINFCAITLLTQAAQIVFLNQSPQILWHHQLTEVITKTNLPIYYDSKLTYYTITSQSKILSHPLRNLQSWDPQELIPPSLLITQIPTKLQLSPYLASNNFIRCQSSDSFQIYLINTHEIMPICHHAYDD